MAITTIGRRRPAGTRLRSLSEIYGYIDWRLVAKRVGIETWKDDVFGRAAQLAYFWFFSLFPMLLIIFVILGYIARGAQMRTSLLGYLRQVIPPTSFDLVRDTLQQVSTHAGTGKLWLGVLTTVWAASSGMSSAIDGLNKAYDIQEARPWWKSRLLAVTLTLALAVIIVIALSILLYGSSLGKVLAAWLGWGEMFASLWSFVQWPLLILFMLAAFLMVYRFAPNLRGQKLRWIGPGAILAVILWTAISLGLRVYLQYFNSYSRVYGALGAVLILLVWIYLSSAVLLIGAELNSEIEHAAAGKGVAYTKKAGERAPGKRA